MKNRLYKKNVILGRESFNKLKQQNKLDVKKHTMFTIIYIFLIFALAILCTVFITPYCSIMFIPLSVSIGLKQFMENYQERKFLKILSADYDNYSIWMNKQLKKDYADKNADLKVAKDIYLKYKKDIQNNTSVIINLFKETLKQKSNLQITVSVLCGLIFLANPPNAKDS